MYNPFRYTFKPPYGTPIDRSHPWAQGLLACWLFNEGAQIPGETLNGICSASSLPIVTWGNSVNGVQTKFTGAATSTYIYKCVPATGSAISILGSCSSATISGTAWLIERETVNTIWAVLITGSIMQWRTATNSGGVRNSMGIFGISNNQRFSWCFADAGTSTATSNSVGYLNGIPQTNAGGATAVAPASSAEVTIGSYDNGSGGNWNGAVDYIFIWNYQIPAAQAKAMTANVMAPYQMFVNPVPFRTASPIISYRPWIYGDQIQEQYG